jgi:hypothetical protein
LQCRRSTGKTQLDLDFLARYPENAKGLSDTGTFRLRLAPQVKLTGCLSQVYGAFELVPLPDYPDVIAYTRTLEDEVWLFIGNFGKTSLPLQVEQLARGRKAELVRSTLGPTDSQDLQPLEARLYRLV